MNNKFNILFIVGCEGTGHHLFEHMVYDGISGNKEYRDIRELVLKYFKANNETKKIIKNKIHKLTSERIGNLCIESASYPYFRPLNKLNSIDLYGYYELFKDMKQINLNFIVLNRDIKNSSLSAYNRFDKSNGLEINDAVRIQEIMKNYINNQIQLIPKDKYIIVDLLDLQKNINSFRELVDKKFNLKIKFRNDKIKISNENKYNSDENYNYVCNYFNDTRLKQFKFFDENTTKLNS